MPLAEEPAEDADGPHGSQREHHIAHQAGRGAAGQRNAVDVGERDDHAHVDGEAAGDVGDGYRVQADGGAGGEREVPDHAVGGIVADLDLAGDDLGMKVAGDQERVERDQGFAFALQDVEDADLERIDQGRRPFPLNASGSIGKLDLDLERVGSGGRHHDVIGANEVFDPLVFDLGVDLVAIDVGIAVDLVEDEDDRLLGLAELGEGIDFAALHVAGDDEQNQIGVAGDVAGQGLADLAADLVDSGCIDHDEPRALEAGAFCCVVLPPLGGSRDRRPVRRADLEDLLSHEGVEHRRLAPADHAERGDLDRGLVELAAEVAQLGELITEREFFLGRQLEARHGGFKALAWRARPTTSLSPVCFSSWSSSSLSCSSAMSGAFH